MPKSLPKLKTGFTGRLPSFWFFLPRAVVIALPFAVGAFCLHMWVFWLMRHHMRRHLYRELNVAGAPTCANCGYDMTLNTSERCPECGVGFDAPALSVPLPDVPTVRLKSWRDLIAPGLWLLAIGLGTGLGMSGSGRWVFISLILLGLVFEVWDWLVKRR